MSKMWGWLLRKYPILYAPLTFWMVFGGAIYGYQYATSETFELKDAVPLGESVNFSVMPQALAGQQGPPVVFGGRTWGYEDTNFVAKVLADQPVILVYNKKTGAVKQVPTYNKLSMGR